MQTPVTKRNAGTRGPAGSTIKIIALAADATVAAIMKKRRGSIRSANPRIALVRLPTTKPACTPLVSDACKNDDNRYSASSAGTTAVADVAYLQMGQDQKAQEIIDEMNTVMRFNPDRNTGPFALAASPARYVVERGDWNGAAELKVRPGKFAYVEAITCFTRALGAARSGNPQAAKADIAKSVNLAE